MNMQEKKGLDFILEILKFCLEKNFAFYTFRNPNEENINIGIQVEGDIISFDNISDLNNLDGFVMCPFDSRSKQKSLFINKDFLFSSSEINIDKFEKLKQYSSDKTTNDIVDDNLCVSTRELYDKQINSIKENINLGKIKKTILSRILIHNTKVSPTDSFISMCNTYKDAYVFFVNIPSYVSWMGASPERLLSYNNNSLKTMALAATRKLNQEAISSIVWNKKELNEQALVGEYIEDLFCELAFSDYTKIGPISSPAGSLVHLKTEYTVNKEFSIDEISKLIDKLHPTPAVCGLPKNKSMSLIREIEKHEREYYAGYLGCVSKNFSCDLFVNLRSMKIINNAFAIYVGGGITKQSTADKEWLETCYKAEILLASL